MSLFSRGDLISQLRDAGLEEQADLLAVNIVKKGRGKGKGKGKKPTTAAPTPTTKGTAKKAHKVKEANAKAKAVKAENTVKSLNAKAVGAEKAQSAAQSAKKTARKMVRKKALAAAAATYKASKKAYRQAVQATARAKTKAQYTAAVALEKKAYNAAASLYKHGRLPVKEATVKAKAVKTASAVKRLKIKAKAASKAVNAAGKAENAAVKADRKSMKIALKTAAAAYTAAKKAYWRAAKATRRAKTKAEYTAAVALEKKAYSTADAQHKRASAAFRSLYPKMKRRHRRIARRGRRGRRGPKRKLTPILKHKLKKKAKKLRLKHSKKVMAMIKHFHNKSTNGASLSTDVAWKGSQRWYQQRVLSALQQGRSKFRKAMPPAVVAILKPPGQCPFCEGALQGPILKMWQAGIPLVIMWKGDKTASKIGNLLHRPTFPTVFHIGEHSIDLVPANKDARALLPRILWKETKRFKAKNAKKKRM